MIGKLRFTALANTYVAGVSRNLILGTKIMEYKTPDGTTIDPETIGEHTELCQPWVGICDRHWNLDFPSFFEPTTGLNQLCWGETGKTPSGRDCDCSLAWWQRIIYNFEQEQKGLVIRDNWHEECELYDSVAVEYWKDN